jgi:hypothetical protein
VSDVTFGNASMSRKPADQSARVINRASWVAMPGYLNGTETMSRLTVRAALDDGIHKTAESASDADMGALNLTRYDICPSGITLPGHDHPLFPARLPIARGGNLFFGDP